jgi:starch synthase (maltosyl-transferring)
MPRKANTEPRTPPPQLVGAPHEGRARAVIDAVLPHVDAGRFAVKCIAGEPFEVTAHVFTDGHDAVRAVLRWHAEAGDAQDVEMRPLGNDEWSACFTPPEPGRYGYTVVAWVDRFQSWRGEMKRRQGEADIRLAMRIGADLLDDAASRAAGEDREHLSEAARQWRWHATDEAVEVQAIQAIALDEAIAARALRYPDRRLQTVWPHTLPLVADRLRARFSAWYELFPRSAGTQPGVHGRLTDVVARLPYLAEMGFDVLYLPPIHPIGRERRKGRNNAEVAEPGDVGSPWAIGASEGGHKAVHPELGTAADLADLVTRAAEYGIEIALDIAFQCAPDHPYVNEHREWFRWRPDGTVQYAENPPKKYQDIYPFEFESSDWPALWQELRSVFDFWIALGVRVFRVDNPHTKPFAFWEWAIAQIKAQHPDVIFLSEAFTRPKVMHRLAKLGFTQSYTYFTWRQTGEELRAYFTELAEGPGRHYFRPNVWPNTPDIFHEQFHHQGRPVFALRVVLAALLCPSYGLYGPAYELLENRPRGPGSEEYLDSEKYQLRHWGETWTVDRPDSVAGLIARLNRLRRTHVALQSMDRLRFHDTDNPQLLVWSRQAREGEDTLIMVLNLDPQYAQSGWVTLDIGALGLPTDAPYELHDALTEQRFTWQGPHNFVILDPSVTPAHALVVQRPAAAAAGMPPALSDQNVVEP